MFRSKLWRKSYDRLINLWWIPFIIIIIPFTVVIIKIFLSLQTPRYWKIILSFLYLIYFIFALLKSLGDKFNEDIKIYGQQLLQEIIGALDNPLVMKINRYRN